MALPETIPTDVVDLTALIRSTPASDRYQIADRLEKEMGDQERAFRLYEQAEGDVIHDELCGRLHDELGEALTAAVVSLAKAETLITRLRSPQVYDVEYAESAEGADLLHLVANTHRGVRLAVTVQKNIP